MSTDIRVLISKMLGNSYASNAEAAAKVVANKALTPANLAAAGVMPTGLTDYANVVVVDAGGNGDYTTISAAMTAITDAAANKQYNLLVFGHVTETGVFTCKDYVHITGLPGSLLTWTANTILGTATYQGLRFATAVTLNPATGKSHTLFDCHNFALSTSTANGYTLRVKNCVMTSVSVNGSTATVWMSDCDTTQVTIDTGTIKLHRVTAFGASSSSTIGHASSGTNPDAELFGCHFRNTAFEASAALFIRSASHLRMKGCTAQAESESYGYAFSYYEAAVVDYITDCTFKSGYVAAIFNNDGGYAGNITHCTFIGTVQNLAAPAGTANGTNVVL